MLRKILFGLVWLIALYFGIGLAIGSVVGAMAGAGEPDPQKAFELGRAAGASVAWLKPYVFFGSAVFVVIGAAKGWLPGTRRRPVERSGGAQG